MWRWMRYIVARCALVYQVRAWLEWIYVILVCTLSNAVSFTACSWHDRCSFKIATIRVLRTEEFFLVWTSIECEDTMCKELQLRTALASLIVRWKCLGAATQGGFVSQVCGYLTTSSLLHVYKNHHTTVPFPDRVAELIDVGGGSVIQKWNSVGTSLLSNLVASLGTTMN